MRFKNETGDLKLYVVAGTTTVLLSFDIDKSKLDNEQFLGYSIERLDSKGVTVYLNGSKHFKSLLDDVTITDHKVKYASLVQSFFWYDYTASPGKKYTYTIKPMFGTAINYIAKYSNSIIVKTEPLRHGKHSVYFNYGVTGSQAYATNKEFGNQPIKQLQGKLLKDALNFLGRELWTDGLLKFVKQAKGANYKLYGAFYEFQYPEFLNALKKAKDGGADVQIVFSAKADQADDNKDKNGNITRFGNVSAIANAGLTEVSHPRKKPSQPHNKFMILFEGDAPKQVWTGSTNITPAGIFGQCNTGHWIVDDDIAMKYFKYWSAVKDDPTMSTVSKISVAIQPDKNLSELANGTYVFFSPRDIPTAQGATPVHLKNYAALIDNAKEMVCMILPFNLDDVFKTVYQEDKDFLRFLIFEKAAVAQGVNSNDIDLKITAGAILDSEVENWTKEVSAGTVADAGILYVHNKFFIIDALSANPVVVTGSANFSGNSITNNDENSIMIKGDKRVADIYLTEFNRLFIHFWPRYLLKKNKGKPNVGFQKPLDETYTWFASYYKESKFDYKRKMMFKNMVL
jgi:phosphatidylserine/phosphatidylglycerophosphate/cardiolipin synthase-like enzyme